MAIVVRAADRAFALDLESRPVDLESLVEAVPGLEPARTDLGARGRR